MRRKSLLAPVIPEKLREAREARGLTMVDLAEMVDISAQAISQFETGKIPPGDATMALLMDKLNFPLAFFTTPRNSMDELYGPKLYRCHATVRKYLRDMVEIREEWLTQNIFPTLSEYIKFPQVNLKTYLKSTPGEYKVEEIEKEALRLRELWKVGLGPFPDIVAYMELNGIVLARLPMGMEFDALSVWFNDRPFIMLAADKNNYFRSRFDAAHEIGHLVLHRKCDLSRGHYRHPDLEREANRFASALLMPQNSFGEEVFAATLDGFLHMKKRWRVSVAAMIHRCQDIGFLTEYQSAYLWKQRNRRGWTQEEPYDNEIAVEQPVLLRKAFELIVENRLETIDDLLDKIALPIQDVEEVCGIEISSLRGTPPAKILKLVPRR
jgi:Zn-dependent peptidase ImmA (M78 family)/transcriptional regulator with XRE-family HTH domain